MVDDVLKPVRIIRDVLIPMPDGVRLAGNLFLPEGDGCYPGILTYIPYLKDGRGGKNLETHHLHFASRGYAVMHVDFRGTGNSEGINPYPMDPQEREDGHEIVEWMAAQPWCTGSIGIWGISYGGNTALSIACTQPPHLKAIIPIHGSYHPYEHFYRPGGCQGLLYNEIEWGTRVTVTNLTPPLLQDTEGRWMRAWRERLEGNMPWMLSWHGEPPDPGFWVRSRNDYSRINVPTFAICGWRDAYRGPTLTYYQGINAPKRLLIGPWKHALPDLSTIEPVGGMHEMDRWWDRWLKGIANGVEDEPPVTIFVRGREEWRHETEWPIARTQTERLCLQAQGSLARTAGEMGYDEYAYDSRVGIASVGRAYPVAIPVPQDQSADDRLSLTYTTSPLESEIEITGTPAAHIFLSASVGETNLVVKLCAVQPDGRSLLITEGWVNTAQPDPLKQHVPLARDEIREIIVALRPTSHVLQPGERLRLCLAGADFPELWPTPQPYQMRVYRGSEHSSYIELPIVPLRPTSLRQPALQPPGVDRARVTSSGSSESYRVHRDLVNRVISYEGDTREEHRIDAVTTMLRQRSGIASTDGDRPWLTSLRSTDRIDLKRPIGTVTLMVETLLTPFDGRVTARIDLDGQLFFSKSWTKSGGDWSLYSATDSSGPVCGDK